MKNLILIRHAKSSWVAPLQDKDRPLTVRGIKDAHLVSEHLLGLLPKTFLVWCSAAERTSKTAIIFAQTISYPIENIIYKEQLYTFDENQLEKTIKSCDNNCKNIILFGHNDAITNFVNKFGDIYIEHVPTAGLVSLEFHTDHWEEISTGKIKKIIFPKDLK
jgi:phosphohistidine phosphatase